MLAAVAATAVMEAGCGAPDGCGSGGPDSSGVSLRSVSYLADHPSITAVRMCAAGGRCETQPVPPVHLVVAPTSTGSTGSASPRPAPQGLEFDRVLPEAVTRDGSDGPPVRLTMTLYAGHVPVRSGQATLGPLSVNPGGTRRCHFRNYRILAELRDDGSLGYQQLA